MIASYFQLITTSFSCMNILLWDVKKDIVFWFLNESLRRYSVTQIYT